MTLIEQFHQARDITPPFGVVTVVRDGQTINIPCLDGVGGAMFVSDDQGTIIDGDGVKWLVGTRGGELVKRRMP